MLTVVVVVAAAAAAVVVVVVHLSENLDAGPPKLHNSGCNPPTLVQRGYSFGLRCCCCCSCCCSF